MIYYLVFRIFILCFYYFKFDTTAVSGGNFSEQ